MLSSNSPRLNPPPILLAAPWFLGKSAVQHQCRILRVPMFTLLTAAALSKGENEIDVRTDVSTLPTIDPPAVFLKYPKKRNLQAQYHPRKNVRLFTSRPLISRKAHLRLARGH